MFVYFFHLLSQIERDRIRLEMARAIYLTCKLTDGTRMATCLVAQMKMNKNKWRNLQIIANKSLIHFFFFFLDGIIHYAR